MIEVRSYPVKGGDCFLIRYKSKNILIDSGYKTTSNLLIKDLKEISKVGECIDLLIITHIDNDHIGGAIKLLGDSSIIDINEIWYNGYKQIFEVSENLRDVDRDLQMKIRNIVSNNSIINIETSGEIGYEEAKSFEELVFKNNIMINKSFNNKVILSKMRIKFDKNIEFIFLSPNKDGIEDIREEWTDILQEYNIYDEERDAKGMPKAFEFYNRNNKINENYVGKISVDNENLKYVEDIAKIECDSKITKINNSSLAFILSIGNINLLFLGDSNHNVVLQELKELIELDEKYKNIKLMKVSHHGSKNNLNNEFLNTIETESFIFSTDGSPKKGGIPSKPHIETIAKIIVKEKDSTLYFNYPQESYDKFIFDIIDKCNKDELYNIKVINGDGIKPLYINIDN